MKTHSISKSSKKLMAILCAVMMLVSCMVFAPVSAATACSCAFSNADSFMTSKWNGNFTNYTSQEAGQYWKNVQCSVVEVDNIQGKAMKMAFTAPLEINQKEGSYAGFRLFNDGAGAVNFTSGQTYAVSFKYKVEAAMTDLTIRVLGGSVNWHGANVQNAGDNKIAATVSAGTTTDWVQAYAVVTPNATGIHLAVQAADIATAAGTVVYVDDILVDDPISYTMDLNYDGGSTSTVKAAAGQTIASAVENPTRSGGYTFLGWYDAAEGGNQVTEFPATATTLYAHWDDPAVAMYTATFHAKPGTLTGAESMELAEGEAITTSAPVRLGWSFTGWADAEGNPVTTMPANDIDLYAQWTKTGEVPTDERVQNFEDGFDNIQNTNKPIMLTDEENHTYAGGAAIKAHIQAGMNGQRTRPRLVLKTNGENFVAEEGKSYIVSFWAKSSVLSGAMNFYLAAYDMDTVADQIVNEAGFGDAHKACHTQQTISVNTSASGALNGKEWNGVLPTEWTQYTITIPSFAAHKNPNDAATQSYLVLGITDGTSDKSTYEARDFYIDDISVAEVADTGLRDFENEELGSVDVRNSGSLKGEVAFGPSHTTVAGKAVKVTQTNMDSGNVRVQMVMKDRDGNVIETTAGKQYLVSFWLYAEDTPQTRFWLAPSANGAAYTDSGEKDKAKIKEQNAYITKAYHWQQVTVLTDAVKEGYEGQLLLGISDARFANGVSVPNNTSVFYVDDISVVEIDSALGKVSGNVGVYKNGDNSYYEQDGVKYGALRLLGGYTVANGDVTKAVIGGNAYTVKARGILLGKGDQTNLTVDGDVYYKSEKTTGLDGYWLMDGDVLKYSLLVNKISKDKIGTKVHYRPYLIVTDGTDEYTLYGDTVIDVDWATIAASAGVDTGWTQE